MSGASIRVDDKRYRASGRSAGHRAIEGLELRVADGEFVCLLGPSGCGKTTLLNLVAGIDRDYRGAIEFDTADPVIAYMFQQPRLLPWRTVGDNLRLALPPGRDDPAALEALLESLGIGGLQQRYPNQLSLGMQRRVALARAFAVRPDLLLMDEPFVSLDELTAERIRQLLLETWRQRRTTVLFVTHDLREAIGLGDRLVLLAESPTRVLTEIRLPAARERRGEALVEELRRQLAEQVRQVG